MHDSIVHHLSQQPQYSNLRSNLMAALDDGLVELDSDGSSFRFVHDKVREAAYDMINSESKDKFHFDIGMVLLASYEQNNTKSTSTLYAILDQINHGILSLQDEAQHISMQSSICKLEWNPCAEAITHLPTTLQNQLSLSYLMIHHGPSIMIFA